jgi:hypothetical protein
MPQEHEYQQQLEEQREFDRENKEKLEAGRQKKSLRKLASEIAREAGVTKASNLWKQLRLTDMFFAVALISSLLKDILDFVGNTNPVLFIICIISAFMASIVTWAAMVICGAGLRQRKKRKLMKSIFTPNKWALLVGGTIFEILPVLDFLPVETLTTFVIFIVILKERRESEAEEQEEAAQMANAYAQ